MWWPLKKSLGGGGGGRVVATVVLEFMDLIVGDMGLGFG